MNLGELESELMLLGIWKNIAELEEHVSLPEMEAILKASHERERRQHAFAAALKGINLDEQDNEDANSTVERLQARADARIRGESPDEAEHGVMGITYTVED